MALLTILLVSFVFGNAFAGSQDLELTDFLDNIIDKLIDGLLTGLIQDVADPLIMDSYDKTFENDSKLIGGRVSLSNVNVTGVKTTAVKNIDVARATSTFNMTVNIKQIIVHCDYDIDLTFLSFVALYGKGNVRATLDGLNLDLHLTATIEATKPYIKNLGVKEIKLLLGDNTSIHLEGLMNDDAYNELVNEVIEEYIQYLKDEPELAAKEITDLIQTILDYIQKDKKINIFQALNVDE